MASQRGKMVSCDRCGESIFIKELEAKENETDGGFTRWNEYKYEDLPEGWGAVAFGKGWGGVSHTLCPRCSELFDKHHKVFFRVGEKEGEE